MNRLTSPGVDPWIFNGWGANTFKEKNGGTWVPTHNQVPYLSQQHYGERTPVSAKNKGVPEACPLNLPLFTDAYNTWCLDGDDDALNKELKMPYC